MTLISLVISTIESVFAPLPRTERGMPLVINGDPKGQNILYCNGNSVVIRNVEVGEITARTSVYITNFVKVDWVPFRCGRWDFVSP